MGVPVRGLAAAPTRTSAVGTRRAADMIETPAAHAGEGAPRGGPDGAPPVLILQHARCEGPGRVGQALHAAGIPYQVIHAADGEPVPRTLDNAGPGGAAGLVVMGGPMGVYEHDQHPHLRAELRLIEAALAARAPVLGICLGSQLIAHALGAIVRPGPRKEIGWFPVHWMAEALNDPIVGPVAAAPLTAFHWHGDVFDLPVGAEHLARSALTPYQAFRYGASVYGLLFHLEVTPPLIAGMTAAFAGELAAEGLDGDALLAAAYASEATLTWVGRQVFGGWAAMAAARCMSITAAAPALVWGGATPAAVGSTVDLSSFGATTRREPADPHASLASEGAT
jgi:GMP synthase (glutamine-hydrolysing)